MAGILMLLLLLSSGRGTAQQLSDSDTLTFFGLNFGYSSGVPLTISRSSGVVNPYGGQLTGSSSDRAISFGLQIKRYRAFTLGLFDEPLGFWAQIDAGLSKGSFVSDPFTVDSVLDPSSLQFVLPHRRLDVIAGPLFMQLSAGVDYPILGRIRFGIGGWLQYRVSSNLEQSETLLDYDSVRFADGTRSHVLNSGASLGSSQWRGGPQVVLSGVIPLAPQVDLSPALTSLVDVGGLVSGLGMRSFRVGGSLTVLFGTGPHERTSAGPEEAVDSVPLPKPPPGPALTASIALLSSNSDSSIAPISLKSVLHRQVIPFLSRLYFEEGSSEIPERYGKLSSAEAGSFALRDLARLDPAEIYYQTLNVLGSRLRSEPAAKIVLDGSISAREPRGLARARAEAVRAYLHGIWGIAEGRMEVRSTVDPKGARPGDARNRCVIIRSRSTRVMMPVATEWIVEERVLSPIRLWEQVQAQAGVRRWALSLTRGETGVARYVGETLEALRTLDVSFMLPKDLSDTASAEVVANLDVEDSTGAIVHARGGILLVPERSRAGSPEEIKASGEIATIVLPGATTDAASRGLFLRGIASTIRPGARIMVISGEAADGVSSVGPGGPSTTDPATVADTLTRLLKERNVTVGEIRVLTDTSAAAAWRIDGPERDDLVTGVHVVIDQGMREQL